MRVVSLLSRSELLKTQLLYLVAAAVLLPFGLLYALLLAKGWNGDAALVPIAAAGIGCAYWLWWRLDRRWSQSVAQASQTAAAAYTAVRFVVGPGGMHAPQPLALAAALAVFISLGGQRAVSVEATDAAAHACVIELTA